jgi:CDP-4-dehydro-6-deoxyglucose reductase, E3
MPPAKFDARLRATRRIAPSVRELVFERSDGQPMTFEPGQWLNVQLPAGHGNGKPVRPYSIASAPDGSSRFELAVTRVDGGYASTWLHGLDPGVVLSFFGPLGFFTRAATFAAPSLMIATGTGVTPLRSMLHAAVARGTNAPMWLVLGVRYPEDVLYQGEMSSLLTAHSHVRFEPTLSQAPAAWTGRRGYVQAHVRDLWDALLKDAADHGHAEPHAYVCGRKGMVSAVSDLLRKELGLRSEQLHSERYD